MTSHAALVARGWGKCCIVGAGEIKVNVHKKTMTVGGKSYKEGDMITLNGTRGLVYAGALKMMDATENPRLAGFMKLVNKFRKLGVRTNADTVADARTRGSSEPRASACSARSTCSTAKGRMSRCSCSAR